MQTRLERYAQARVRVGVRAELAAIPDGPSRVDMPHYEFVSACPECHRRMIRTDGHLEAEGESVRD